MNQLVLQLVRHGMRYSHTGASLLIPDGLKATIIATAERLKTQYHVTYRQFCEYTDLDPRRLRRYRSKYDPAQGAASLQPQSRRPHRSPAAAPPALVDLLCHAWTIFPPHVDPPAARPGRDQDRLTEFCRWFSERYQREIQTHCGQPTLSRTCITIHLRRRDLYDPQAPPGSRARRGNYQLYGYLLQVVMDTTDLYFLGYRFKHICLLDIASRQVLSHQTYERETSEETVEVFRTGAARYPQLLGLLRDRGTPYRSHAFQAALGEYEAIVACFSAVHHPEDKAHIERWFRTFKDFLADIQALLRSEGLDDLSFVPEPLRPMVTLLVARVVKCVIRYFYNRIPQPCIDGLTPHERAEQPPNLTREEATLALHARAQANEPKEQFIASLTEFFGGRLFTDDELRRLRAFSLEALREAKTRYQRHVLNGRFIAAPFRYFCGIARVADEEHTQRALQEAAYRTRLARENRAQREHQEQWAAQLQSDRENPLRSAAEWCAIFIQAWDQLGARHPVLPMIRKRIASDLERMHDKLCELFWTELDRLKHELSTHAGGDETKQRARQLLDECADRFHSAQRSPEVSLLPGGL